LGELWSLKAPATLEAATQQLHILRWVAVKKALRQEEIVPFLTAVVVETRQIRLRQEKTQEQEDSPILPSAERVSVRPVQTADGPVIHSRAGGAGRGSASMVDSAAGCAQESNQ